jgi:nitronate monooxygenase
MVQAAQAARVLSVPVVIGGGIGTGSQLAAVLAMGCDGVIMGTRLLVAEELWIHRAYKEFLTAADGTESTVVKKALRDHHRVLRNESAQAVEALDAANVTDFEQYRPHVTGTLAHEAYLTGDMSRGMLDFGPAAAFADRIETMEAILDRVLDEAVAAARRVNTLACHGA